MTEDFDLRLLSRTSLNSPEGYPDWKIARNCAVALGAVTACGALALWAGGEAGKRLTRERSSRENRRE